MLQQPNPLVTEKTAEFPFSGAPLGKIPLKKMNDRSRLVKIFPATGTVDYFTKTADFRGS
jgi:hypothetical protein